jgi:hypothetical protein
MFDCKKALSGPSKAPTAKDAWAIAFIATPTSISLFTIITNLFSNVIFSP